MLGLDETGGWTVVADLEAGIGTLTRLGEGGVDAAVVVVEPTTKSIEVAARAVGLVRERGIQRVLVVANRVRHADDVATVAAALPGEDVMAVPEDDQVSEAERAGVAPLDVAPASPAMAALRAVAHRLVAAG